VFGVVVCGLLATAAAAGLFPAAVDEELFEYTLSFTVALAAYGDEA
jgi:hypothetical protein